VAGAVAGLGRAIRGLFFAEAPGGARAGADAAALHDRLGPGRALDGDVRSRMETAFGAPFGSVRIHDDAEAAALSSDLNARAFTVGQHVAFGGGEYRPGNPVGDALLAHELAHTLQQPAVALAAAPVHAPEPEVEGEADAAAVEAVGAIWGGAPNERIRKRPRAHGGLRLSRCGGAAAQLARTPRPAAPVPAWRNRPEMEVPLRAAVAALWASPVDVDHNTAANLVAGHPPVYGTDELIPATDSLGRRRQGRCTLPDPERNLGASCVLARSRLQQPRRTHRPRRRPKQPDHHSQFSGASSARRRGLRGPAARGPQEYARSRYEPRHERTARGSGYGRRLWLLQVRIHGSLGLAAVPQIHPGE
jgi:hypothetical protein